MMEIKLLEAYEIPDLYKILSRPEVANHLCANPNVITENNLGRFMLAAKPNTYSEAFAVYFEKELVGTIAINDICHLKNSAHIGVLAITPDIKETSVVGVGLKAAKWVLRYCFEVLNLNRVYAHTWSDNPQISSIYKRLGAVHEGTEREHTWKQGKYIDMNIWSILRREWESGGIKNGS